MCGIFAIVSRRGPVDVDMLDRGTDAVEHRGPDGRGTLVEGAVGLGHRRLAIIDTSDAGLQPMTLEGSGLTIIYNGEIYNYLELRAELAARGAVFRTGTDTEVILAAYREWGDACVERFNGMWAFVLLDRQRRRLLCSRDRFGVKPLQWIETPELIAFGSEARQLVPLLRVRCASRTAVDDFLASGLTDHRAEGWLAGLRMVPPGHHLVLDLQSLRASLVAHYRPQPAAAVPESAAATAGRLAELLEGAVRLRLRSDVRVGTCLSGGLDSSSVAALASALQPAGTEAFRAITAVSETPENSEEAFARDVVQRARLAWIPVRPVASDFEADLDEMFDAQEAPVPGPSVAMQHFVMAAARECGVKVLLDGQGGDECWLGYERHAAVWLRDALRRGPLALAAGVRDLAAHHGNLTPARIAGLLVALAAPGWVGRKLAARYPAIRRQPPLPAAWSAWLAGIARPESTLVADLLETSLPMLLRFADRSSMRHGVEVRLPFLDVRLVEHAMATPVRFKLHDGWSKWPLRQGLAPRLPASIAWRRRKLGFEAPDRLWLARIRPRMKREVEGSRLVGELFDRSHLVKAFDSLSDTQAWRLFSLAVWERQQQPTDLA